MENLCTHCGLCCSGSLFSHAPLEITELDSLQRIRWHMAGVKLIQQQQDWYFQLPCGAYQEGVCRCYAQRPQICNKFNCRIIRALASGEIDETEALRVIHLTQDHIQGLGRHLRDAPQDHHDAPLHERLRLFREWYAELQPEQRESYAHLMVEQRALLMLFEMYFY